MKKILLAGLLTSFFTLSFASSFEIQTNAHDTSYKAIIVSLNVDHDYTTKQANLCVTQYDCLDLNLKYSKEFAWQDGKFSGTFNVYMKDVEDKNPKKLVATGGYSLDSSNGTQQCNYNLYYKNNIFTMDTDNSDSNCKYTFNKTTTQ